MKRSVTRAVAVLAGAWSLGGCVVATSSNSRSGGGGFVFLLLPLLMLFLVFSMIRRGTRSMGGMGGAGGTRGGIGGGRRHRGAVERHQPEEANAQMLRAELSVLADDVVRLEPQVALKDEARDDYEAATHRYRVAHAALDYADAPVDLVRVQRVVDEANWSMARARATLEGRRPPAPPPTLQHAGPHGEPAIRVDDSERPVYVGSPASFRSGWFGVGGGLFGGLLLGTMLSGFGWESDDYDAYDE